MLKRACLLQINNLPILLLVLSFLKKRKIRPISGLTVVSPGKLKEAVDQFMQEIGCPPVRSTMREDDEHCTIGLALEDAEQVRCWAEENKVLLFL